MFATLFSTPALADHKIIMQLRWDNQFQFAGFYAAEWQGLYKEAGLDVEIRSAVTEEGRVLNGVNEVGEGRAHFGLGAGEILRAREHGTRLVILASFLQQSPVGIFARKSANVSTPADLGKIRVRRLRHQLTDAELSAVLKAGGIDPDSIKDELPELHKERPFPLLRDGKIDA